MDFRLLILTTIFIIIVTIKFAIYHFKAVKLIRFMVDYY